ncbi:MAG: Peptidase BlaR1 [Pedosphaera sp.]|nr:Peptidase BlaR1 [Pedosphaera sp.]
MNHFSSHTFLTWLLHTSWQASILVILVALIHWVFRNQVSSRWRHVLWLVVLIRLLLPSSPSSPFSVFNYFHPKLSTVFASHSGVAASGNSMTPARNSGRASAPTKPEEPPIRRSWSAAVSPARGSQNIIPGVLIIIWLTGVIALAIRILMQDLRFAARLGRTRMVTNSEVLKILEDCRRSLQIPFPVPLLETSEVTAPALYGAVRPRLLIPEGLAAAFDARELRHIFLHELAHVKRHDMIVHWLMTATQVLHWFNPLVWAAMARMRLERELACDALALSHEENEENESYGQTIIKLLDGFVRPMPTPGVVGILEKQGPIKERIVMIARFKKAPQWSAFAIVLILGLVLTGLTDARPLPAEAPDMMAWWPADGDSRDVVTGNNAVLLNGVGFADGRVGQAFAFEGSGANQVVQVTDAPNLNPSNAFTLEVWLYLTRYSINDTVAVIEKGGVYDSLRQYEIGLVDINGRWFIRPHLWLPGGLAILAGATPVEVNTWYHVAMTYDGKIMKLYVNGNVDGSMPASGPITVTANPLLIGGDGFGGWDFAGLVDELSLYNRALSAEEIQSIYEAGSAGKSEL